MPDGLPVNVYKIFRSHEHDFYGEKVHVLIVYSKADITLPHWLSCFSLHRFVVIKWWKLTVRRSTKNWFLWSVPRRFRESRTRVRSNQPFRIKPILWRNDVKAGTCMATYRRVDYWKRSDAGNDWAAWGQGQQRTVKGWMALMTLWFEFENFQRWWIDRCLACRRSAQRVGHGWAIRIELNWLRYTQHEYIFFFPLFLYI